VPRGLVVWLHRAPKFSYEQGAFMELSEQEIEQIRTSLAETLYAEFCKPETPEARKIKLASLIEKLTRDADDEGEDE
jgi:hypothetical protein